MNYRELSGILRRKEMYWSNGATGATGDGSVDPNPSKDPNDYLQPLAGNKFYQIIAIVAVLGLVIAVAIMATKKSQV